MIEMKIEMPIEASQWALIRLGKDLSAAIKPILASLATAGKKMVQKNMGAYLTQRTGWLRRHVYGIRRSEKHYVVAAPRHIAEPLERGATITPKNGKVLYIGGAQGRVGAVAKTITIPARHWFTKSIAGFEDSPEYAAAVDKGLNRAIKKFGTAVWGKP
jgi:hypothetical protein